MKDSITVTVTLEAEFQTIQDIRLALEDDHTKSRLAHYFHLAAKKGLSDLTQDDYSFETEVKSSRYRRTKVGPRDPIPQVKNGVLSWFDMYEDKENVVGKVGSKRWVAWLTDTHSTSFAFISKHKVTFTAFKRKDGKWYAHKQLGGKLKRRYLGVGESVTLEKMERIAFELAQRELA